MADHSLDNEGSAASAANKSNSGERDGDIASDLSFLLETEIRNLAHAKWQAAGCPILESDEDRNAFWYAAEKEILERNAIKADRH